MKAMILISAPQRGRQSGSASLLRDFGQEIEGVEHLEVARRSGQTLHGDHGYVFYQVPVSARRLPLVLWHGFGQFSRTWETTPDGRVGFQSLFLRRGFPVYVIDQPRRGRAGRSTLPATNSHAGGMGWRVATKSSNVRAIVSYTNPGQDGWRVRLAMARLWRDAVNGRGGDVTVVHLPEIGIRGNTDFPFSDLNSLEIADLMSQFLKRKGLD